MSEPKYKMSMNLNVLNHLGINLYSNVPAVLSEVVANSWDADAENVDIKIFPNEHKIVISDDGNGMTNDDINEKYLCVGYQKRKVEPERTPKNRLVMGRKGIGKLSLFSIASTIEIFTCKNGERNGFKMEIDKIKEKIESGERDYSPPEIPVPDDLMSGTRIVISNTKKNLRLTTATLKKRLARRFSIIGNDYNFSVSIGGEKITIEDRDYFYKVQYLWWFGKESEKIKDFCKNKEESFQEFNEIIVSESSNNIKYLINGWIGTAKESGDLKNENEDDLNKIQLLVRGKLAVENMLDFYSGKRLFTKYLMGEIHADFLDLTEQDDITTSSRQNIKEDDPRFLKLQEFINLILTRIGNKWTDLRNESGTNEAKKIPVINDWLNTLRGDDKKHADALFGKINSMHFESEKDKRELFKHSVLAFENMKYKRKLLALENLTSDDIQKFAIILADFDDIEATLYHQIVKERLEIIDKLNQNIDENAIEKILQKYLYNHLWLLDPSWDRPTETPYMEKHVTEEFNKINAGLDEDEKEGRIDIKYKKASGKHIIIELKRANRKVNEYELMRQVDKYRKALEKLLQATEKYNEPIEVICVVGRALENWSTPKEEEKSRNSMAEKQTRVVLYQRLIEDAQRSYIAFLEKNREIGKLRDIIDKIHLEGLDSEAN